MEERQWKDERGGEEYLEEASGDHGAVGWWAICNLFYSLLVTGINRSIYCGVSKESLWVEASRAWILRAIVEKLVLNDRWFIRNLNYSEFISKKKTLRIWLYVKCS